MSFPRTSYAAVNSSIRSRLFAPVDIASLVFFRIAFGLIMLWEVLRYFDNKWIKLLWMDTTFHFTYWGFDWVRPWPGDGMYMHFFILGFLAVCITIGLWYRVCTALFSLGFTFVFLLDKAYFLNHFYLICLISLLMIFMPANQALSVDVWRRPEIRSNTAPAWALWLLRVQIGIVYLYGGLAKLNGDWLHAQPFMLILNNHPKIFIFIDRISSIEWIGYIASYYGLLLDLFVVPLLLWKRTRWFALGAAITFHLLNAWLFQIGIFPWMMIAATLLFLPPDWPRLGGRLWPVSKHEKHELTVKTNLRPGQRVILVIISVFLLVQLLFPLRHFLYPGSVIWTEEGILFAWHMLSRQKITKMRIIATDPITNKLWFIDPTKYLNPKQFKTMSHSPDMILQFSQYITNELYDNGYEGIEIRAEVITSLNGRRPQYLIDPAVNLAAQPRDLLPAKWIMPLKEPLPKNNTGSYR